MAKQKSTEYINKQELTEQIIQLQLHSKLKENRELQTESSGKDLDALKIKERELIDAGANPDYTRQRFGEMVLLIIDNLMKKPCFSGYTENWSEDFKSNAIYKIFLYIHNFDPNKISKNTGKKVSSFAYLTQITYMAFVEVINKRKAEEKKMFQTMIPLQDVKVDYYTQDREYNASSIDDFEPVSDIFIADLSDMDLKDGELYEHVVKLAKQHANLHIMYPENYPCNIDDRNSISMDEYMKIMSVNHDLLRITKKIQEPEVKEEFDEDDVCFLIDDEVQDWEWESDD